MKVNLILASLWTSLMFIIIYLDYFHLYMPGSLKDIFEGKAFIYDINQEFLLAAFVMVTTPALMIYLSIALPVHINRSVNIVIAAIYVPLILYNLAGVAWAHMIVGAGLQVILLGLIIYHAWRWRQAVSGNE